MISGYVTFDELLLITGFNEKYLKKLLLNGLYFHELHIDSDEMLKKGASVKHCLFDLKEVEDWIKVHVF